MRYWGQYFHSLEEIRGNPEGKGSMALMILALTYGLWNISGRGFCSVTREIERAFVNEIKNNGFELIDDKTALQHVREYFIKNKFARDTEHEFKGDEVEFEVKNCRFFGLCKRLENQGVLITICLIPIL